MLNSQYNIIRPSKKKADAREEYAAFLDHWQIPESQFSFEYEASVNGRALPIRWKAVSWGWFESSKKCFRVYITWSAEAGKLRRQVSWIAIAERFIDQDSYSEGFWLF